jgi:hypothetical protein
MKRLQNKKKKYNLFPKLSKYYVIYRKLLKEDQEFNWSFFIFIYRLFISKSYELNTIDNLYFILLCKIDKLNKEIHVEYSYISDLTMSNVYLITSLNIQLNKYCVQYGYNTIILSIRENLYLNNKDLFRYLSFESLKNKILLVYLENNSKNKIILSKTI